MNDCPNGMMRDRLPDLLHGRLDAGARAEVEAHVRGCVDCEAELALLAELRDTLRATPAVNVAAIVAALPAPSPQVSVGARRPRWADWRAAAAIALVAGGTSLVVLRQPSVAVAPAAIGTTSVPATSPPVASQAVAAPVAEPSAQATESAAAVPTRAGGVRPRELAVGGASVSDLSDQELSALLRDIESFDATPSLEVEGGIPVTPVTPGKDGV